MAGLLPQALSAGCPSRYNRYRRRRRNANDHRPIVRIQIHQTPVRANLRFLRGFVRSPVFRCFLMNAPAVRQHIVPVLATALRFRFLIVGCITFCTLGGILYALSSPKVYQASVPFLVRDEISGPFAKPGRFESLEAMKSAQETIQEITQNPEVLKAALKSVGPSSWFTDPEQFPSFEDIETFRENVWISAANGAELGKTEVIHLNVRSTSRDRALDLIQHVSDGVRQQLRQVRGRRATSIRNELQAALETAELSLADTTRRVVAMEVELGEDLSELRTLENPHSGEGSLRSALVKIQTELLTNQTQRDEVEQQIHFLQQASQSPERLAALPSELFVQFPGLGELKRALTAAQLEMAELSGTFNSQSSQYRLMEQQIANIKKQIHQEIGGAVDSAKAQKTFVQARSESLTNQRESLKKRIKHLASLRAPYANLLEEMKVATEQYRVARAEHSEAVAMQNGTAQTDLLTQLEPPEVGTRPVSVSRSSVVLGSLGGGVFLSLGLVMMLSAPGVSVSTEELERLARERDANDGNTSIRNTSGPEANLQ